MGKRKTVFVRTGPDGAGEECAWRRVAAGNYRLERVRDGRTMAEVATLGGKWAAWSLQGSSAGFRTMAEAKRHAEMDCVLYDVIRFRFQGRRRRILSGVRWSVAHAHCNDPATSKPGVWFDGFEVAQ